MMRISLPCVAVASLAILALLGCGGSSTTTSSTNYTDLTEGAAAGIASDASDAMATATQTDSAVGPQASAAVTSATAASSQECPSITINSTGSNGQWTEKTFTYTNPPCSWSGFRGQDTFSITGSIVLNRSNDTDEYNFTKNINDLVYTFTKKSVSSTETRNGSRDITADASLLTDADNMTVVFAGTKHDGTLVHQLTHQFTPASGTSIEKGQPLPNGTVQITGDATWTATDGTSAAFVVTTLTPLAYDASCRNTQPSVFDSGELQVAISGSKTNGTATITWSDCQAPTVTFTGTN